MLVRDRASRKTTNNGKIGWKIVKVECDVNTTKSDFLMR